MTIKSKITEFKLIKIPGFFRLSASRATSMRIFSIGNFRLFSVNFHDVLDPGPTHRAGFESSSASDAAAEMMAWVEDAIHSTIQTHFTCVLLRKSFLNFHLLLIMSCSIVVVVSGWSAEVRHQYESGWKVCGWSECDIVRFNWSLHWYCCWRNWWRRWWRTNRRAVHRVFIFFILQVIHQHHHWRVFRIFFLQFPGHELPHHLRIEREH